MNLLQDFIEAVEEYAVALGAEAARKTFLHRDVIRYEARALKMSCADVKAITRHHIRRGEDRRAVRARTAFRLVAGGRP